MASMTPAAVAGKPSFAKVAAMAPPQKVVSTTTAQTKATESQKDFGMSLQPDTPAKVVPATTKGCASQTSVLPDVDALANGIEKLTVIPEVSLNHSPIGSSTDTVPVTTSTEDDRSHLSSSSTKPASFDTKSMASENTFAMDEKESLRPDDSASVQAADEDEPFFVPPVFGRSDLQMPLDGSNVNLRRPLHDRTIVSGPAGRQFPMTIMANPPRFGDIMPAAPPGLHQNLPPLGPFAIKQDSVESLQQYPAGPAPPDEKIIEAMGTPKDRLLLLQLEERFLAFIAQSRDDMFDLPPQNSYERLLAHKLADYYNLVHYSPPDSNSIRLCKTIGFKLPLPLSELVRGIVGRDSLPTGAAAVKIMRRTALSGNKLSNEGSTAASSSVPSKATSDAGAENTSEEGMPSPPDTASSKDRSKWTREEKEAHYKAARERIFRDFQEAQPTENLTGDASANMSRSSSSSGRKKGHKQKTPKDDSFEVRSSYVPGYGGMPYSSQNQYVESYSASGHQSPYGAQTPSAMPTMTFGANPTPAYNQYDPSATVPGTNYTAACPNYCGSNDGWSNPQPSQAGGYYNFVQQPGPSYSPYGSGISSPVNQYPPIGSATFPAPNQQWGLAQYSQPYQAQPPMQVSMGQNGASMSWTSYPPYSNAPSPGSPYQFAQAPFQQYSLTPPPPVNQHPIPGSYNRPAFNPQTRSFVPGGPSPRFGGQAGHSRATNPYFIPQSGSSTPNAENTDLAARASSAAKKAQESLQKKWGTPAHLPKKPPPPSQAENTPPLPSKTSFPPLASSIVKSSTPVGQ